MSEMEKNIIKLKTDKTLTVLSGNPYGQSLFKEQIKDKFDLTKMNVIVFPAQINDIAASFIQGFFKWIIDSFGIEIFLKHVKIESPNEYVVQKIYDNIY